MRGEDLQQSALFSCLSPEQRVPKSNPLRKLLTLVDAALARMSRRRSCYALCNCRFFASGTRSVSCGGRGWV